jgi:hypothetical protein
MQFSFGIQPNPKFLLEFNQVQFCQVKFNQKQIFLLEFELMVTTVEVMEFMWNQFLYPTNLLGSAVVKH